MNRHQLSLTGLEAYGGNRAARSLWPGIDNRLESKMTPRGIGYISSACKTDIAILARAKKALFEPSVINPFATEIEIKRHWTYAKFVRHAAPQAQRLPCRHVTP
jgi:hypothetical protein